jgi:hypothetical protein
VTRAFNFLKTKVSYFEALNRRLKLLARQHAFPESGQASPTATLDTDHQRSMDEFFFYNFTLANIELTATAGPQNHTSQRKASSINENIFEQDEHLLVENNLGLTALQRLDCDVDKASYMHANNLAYNVAKYEDNHLDKLNEESVFYRMCEKLFEKCKVSVDACEREESKKGPALSANPRQGLKLLFYFVQQFSFTLPLWTKLMCPGENRDFHLPISLDLHRERLSKLESMASVNEAGDKESLDSFIKRLHAEDEAVVQENVRLFGLNEREFTFNVWSKQNESELFKLKKTFQYNDGRTVDTGSLSDVLTHSNLGKKLKQSGKQTVRRIKVIKTSKNELLKLKKGIADRHSEIAVEKMNPRDEVRLSEEHVFSLICLSQSDMNLVQDSSGSNELESMVQIEEPAAIVASVTACEENENEKEVVIERQQQILASIYDIELIKEDLETLERPHNLNSSVKIHEFLDSAISFL